MSMESESREQIHAPYESELRFYNCIRLGDLDQVRAIQSERSLCDKLDEMGVLSMNPVRNMRYHIIISIATITRYCIDGGMPPEYAYHLSDIYIRQVDLLNDIRELQRLNDRMALDFAKRMLKMHKEKVYSKNIVKCIDYIYMHIRDRVTAKELALHCSLHPSYLSRLFREEVGIGINEYIRQAKVESAKNMLRYSEDSYLTISNNLAFSSQSHFVKVFREQTGMTPKEYRDKYYRKGLGETDV